MSERLVIHQASSLKGEVILSGAKNAALPMLCAALLTCEDVVLDNVPRLKDVEILIHLLQDLGVSVKRENNTVILNAEHVHNYRASYDLVTKMRASVLVLGPLLAHFGRAKVALPGGCAIGSRPVDQHIKGFEAMGANITVKDGYINAQRQGKRLKAAHICPEMITVTGTENLLMAAVLADGESIIEPAACEPEVGNLAQQLCAMGSKIKGIGTSRLVVQGVERLHGTTGVGILPDRIEAGTFMAAVTATGGDIILRSGLYDSTLNGQHWPAFLKSTYQKLQMAGAMVDCKENTCRIAMPMGQKPKAMSFRTEVYPAFPTDMQAQLMAVNTIAKGSATMVESIFENRFMHVAELCRLGADINVHGNTATTHGVDKLMGAPVEATDLRASASLIIAALMAEGSTSIGELHHLERGYSNIENKLQNLGATLARITA